MQTVRCLLSSIEMNNKSLFLLFNLDRPQLVCGLLPAIEGNFN